MIAHGNAGGKGAGFVLRVKNWPIFVLKARIYFKREILVDKPEGKNYNLKYIQKMYSVNSFTYL